MDVQQNPYQIGDEQKKRSSEFFGREFCLCAHGVQNRPPLQKFLDPPLVMVCGWIKCRWKAVFSLHIVINSEYIPNHEGNGSRSMILLRYTRVCRPFLKMAVTAVWGLFHDASISRSLQNTLVYLCAKFDAFMTKCTIGLLCRCTSNS